MITARTERDVLMDIEEAAFRLLGKLHRETACGRHGDHWAECDRLIAALGWTSWEVWREMVRRGGG
jgi:hypothetical protein